MCRYPTTDKPIIPLSWIIKLRVIHKGTSPEMSAWYTMHPMSKLSYPYGTSCENPEISWDDAWYHSSQVRVTLSSGDILRESWDVMLDTLCPRSELSRLQWISWENPEMPRGDTRYLASQVWVVPSLVDILGESRDAPRWCSIPCVPGLSCLVLSGHPGRIPRRPESDTWYSVSQVQVVLSSVNILGESRDVLRVIPDTLCRRSELSRPQWTSWENPDTY